jgi:hypothetical protein
MSTELLIHHRMKPATQSTDTSRTYLQSEGDENNGGKKANIGADITEAIFLLWSYMIQFAGFALTIGLVLNLCGYAYSFDFKHGLEIDTLNNKRKQIQFQREITRPTSTSKTQDTLKAVEDVPSLLP